MVLYELLTGGSVPYATLSNTEVRQGGREREGGREGERGREGGREREGGRGREGGREGEREREREMVISTHKAIHIHTYWS